jgi:hypothetical protein
MVLQVKQEQRVHQEVLVQRDQQGLLEVQVQLVRRVMQVLMEHLELQA